MSLHKLLLSHNFVSEDRGTYRRHGFCYDFRSVSVETVDLSVLTETHQMFADFRHYEIYKIIIRPSEIDVIYIDNLETASYYRDTPRNAPIIEFYKYCEEYYHGEMYRGKFVVNGVVSVYVRYVSADLVFQVYDFATEIGSTYNTFDAVNSEILSYPGALKLDIQHWKFVD